MNVIVHRTRQDACLHCYLSPEGDEDAERREHEAMLAEIPWRF